MPRPKGKRLVHSMPCCCHFAPADIQTARSELITLNLDEFEAIRLSDIETMYQAQAAEKMEVSRPTFTRLLESAHRKIAQAIVHGQELKIEGGNVKSVRLQRFICNECNRIWDVVQKRGNTMECPVCHGQCLCSQHNTRHSKHREQHETKCTCHDHGKVNKNNKGKE